MSIPLISINQLAEFSKATPKGKKRILNQQITPNKFLIPWYQSAKGPMKRYLMNPRDDTPLSDGISRIESKPAVSTRQLTDNKVSIEALKKLRHMPLPKMLSTISYELVKVDKKIISLYGIKIKVAPDLIIKGKIDKTVIYGAIKFHICKSKPFDYNQAKTISTLLYKYLMNNVVERGDKVMPELCFCLDIFSERIVGAPVNTVKEMTEIKGLCLEINKIWDTV